MKKVIIESPYAGDVEKSIDYARKCVKDSLTRGEAPIASRLLYTQPGILDDDKPDQRKLGIDAGLEWLSVADIHAFYTDLGWSKGMEAALAKASAEGKTINIRTLIKNLK
jgi:hypothetical protein